MSKTYNNYTNSVDRTWYDSSNIIYSECFDTQDDNNRNVKIVFKGGRTYMYSDVTPLDYVMFRDSQSQGKVFNTMIKKYPCERLDDTDLSMLETLRQDLIKLESYTEYNITLKYNNSTGELKVLINGEPRFEGVEGRVSVVNLFRAMGLKYTMEETEEHNSTSDDYIKAANDICFGLSLK